MLADRRRTWDQGGHRVAVFGASSGIGAEVARRFHQRGARVIALDVRPPTDPAIPWSTGAVDVRDEASVADALGVAVTRWDALDVVINCAGILGKVGDVRSLTTDDIRVILDINLLGAFAVTRQALDVMVPTGYGRIVHIASMAGKEGNAGQSAYSASKAGVIAMVKSVGKEYAKTGVTINAVAPAIIDTPLVTAMSPEDRAKQSGLVPMGRFGRASEVASTVEFAASPDASFTTGFTYDVSGGRATY